MKQGGQFLKRGTVPRFTPRPLAQISPCIENLYMVIFLY